VNRESSAIITHCLGVIEFLLQLEAVLIVAAKITFRQQCLLQHTNHQQLTTLLISNRQASKKVFMVSKVRKYRLILLLQELVEDVAVATSSRHADLSWARRFAVASPRFIGRRSASTVLSQDCLGRPALRLQSPGESIMDASRAR